MLKCPSCKRPSSEFNAVGCLMMVTLNLAVDATGNLREISPAVVTKTLDMGARMNNPNINLICPSCGNTYPATEFVPMLICAISGQEAEQTIAFPGYGNLAIAKEHLELANQIFTQYDAWDNLNAAEAQRLYNGV